MQRYWTVLPLNNAQRLVLDKEYTVKRLLNGTIWNGHYLLFSTTPGAVDGDSELKGNI